MSKKWVIIVLVLVLGIALTIKNMKDNRAVPDGTSFTDLADSTASAFGQGGTKAVVETSDNSSDELRAVLAEMTNLGKKVAELQGQVNDYKGNRPSAEIEGDVGDIKRDLNLKNSEIETLNKKIESLQKNIRKENNTDFKTNQQLGINNSIPKTSVERSDDSIPVLSRPNSKTQKQNKTASNGHQADKDNAPDNQNLSVETTSTIIWYASDDQVTTVDKKGLEIVTYPFTSLDISGVKISKDDEDLLLEQKEKSGRNTKQEITTHEIYTVPVNSTLWDAISMGSMIGRVPSGGTLKNPFRFKVLLSNDNMASNGIYIPNLKDMVLSGYLEGDMLLECVRGTIDSATYTFNDGRIATQGGEGKGDDSAGGQIAHISDQWGNECIPGTYVSTLDKYITYVGGASAISSVGELLSSAGSTTTTDGTSITKTISSSASGSSVLGSALEGAATATSDFIEDQLEDAFSAVLIEAGEPLVIHVDSQIRIDYDTNGRQIINNRNVEEFLN